MLSLIWVLSTIYFLWLVEESREGGIVVHILTNDDKDRSSQVIDLQFFLSVHGVDSEGRMSVWLVCGFWRHGCLASCYSSSKGPLREDFPLLTRVKSLV